MVLAMTVCEICPPAEVEIMISVLLNIFDTRTSLMNLMKLMIEREVAQTGVVSISYVVDVLPYLFKQTTKQTFSEAIRLALGFYPPFPRFMDTII